jgi:hypothetical protein
MSEKIESQFSNTDFSFILQRMDGTDDQLDFNFAADDLLEFPRDLGEEGYFQFNSERKQALQALGETFGISINQRVRLRLRDQAEEFEGMLMLDSLLLPSPDDKIIFLRIGKTAFANTEIEHCHPMEN